MLLLLPAVAAVAAEADLHAVVFQGGRPVPAVEIRIDGEARTRTGRSGDAWLTLAAGTRELSLWRDGSELGHKRFVVPESGSVQLLATLPQQPGVPVEFVLEGAGPGVTEAPVESQAGQGTVRFTGEVVSAEAGQPVANARIYLAGVEGHLETDETGAFSASIPAGTYQASVVHPDYSTREINQLTLAADEPVARRIELTPVGLSLAEYTVTTPHVEGSVASVFSAQRDSGGVSEVIGADQMSRSGDSDAADALSRVTGLTIEDGKFVVIRGQPARYTYTLWNGSPLPSPDPIRRIVPLDMFPTGVLASIEVEKSYHAASPGAFGGGLIRLKTAGVPDEPFFSVSASVGGRDNTLGETGLDYEGGASDFVGVDDGTREQPAGLENASGANERDEIGKDFSNIWEVEESTIGPDTGLGISGGTRGTLFGAEAGIRAGVDWSRSFSRRETIERDYALRDDGTLVARNDQVEQRTDMDVDLGGLMVGALKWDDHELRSNTFLIRKTSKRSQVTEGTRVVSDDMFIRDFLLDWNERELLAQQFIGSHRILDMDLEWRFMTAESSRYAPDRRDYIYRRRSDGTFVFYTQNGARRRFSESVDNIDSFSVDLERALIEGSGFSWLLAGGAATYTQARDSQVRRFRFDTLPGADSTLPPEELLDPANLGDTLELSDDTQTNDNYLGDASVDGVYLSTTLDWTDRFKLVLGVRHEQADFLVTTFQAGGSQGGTAVQGGFQRSDTLPSISATFGLGRDMQLRLSGNRTVSRPVLNELSPARYFDPESGEEFLGNPDLEPAVIDGGDLRWEWYPGSQEALSVGYFFKDYTDPIEESFVGVGGSSFLRQIQNASGATVEGVEASARLGLSRLTGLLGAGSGWASDFYLQTNLAFIDSEVELAQQDLATSARRPLQGQADSVANLQFGYDGSRHDFTLSYNRIGERLDVAGVQGQPDVFLQPVESLDFNYSFDPAGPWSLKLGLDNLLDPDIESLQGDEVFRSYRKGRKFGLSVSWALGES